MRFNVKRPQVGKARKGKRKTFAIVQDDPGGTPRFSTVDSPALRALNSQYIKGIITLSVANKHVDELVAGLERAAGIMRAPRVFNFDNQKILDSYWEEEYVHRDLADPDAALGKLTQAVTALAEVSLLVGTQKQIQAKLDHFKGDKQRMLVGKINALLSFVKRRHEIRLKKARAERPKVRYLNEAELRSILPLLDPGLGLLVQVLFYTGMRLGEAFAVEAERIKPNRKTVYVDTQLDRKSRAKRPKWGSERSVYLVAPAADLIGEWCAKRGALTDSRDVLRTQFKEACLKATRKNCSFKELRHSYAILLLGKGVSLSLIAQSLGNSEPVCRRHYAGFQLSEDSIEAIDAIVSRNETKS